MSRSIIDPLCKPEGMWIDPKPRQKKCQPPSAWEAANTHNEGATWKCAECGKVWELAYHADSGRGSKTDDGYYWKFVRKEMPLVGVPKDSELTF